MRLGIISDTHLPRGARRIPDACLDRLRAADAILHAGDLVDVAVLELLRALGPPLHAIHGNVDTASIRAVLPARVEIELGGVRVGMIHAPGAASGRLRRLRAAFLGCQAVVFGHSHLPLHESDADGFQIFNPGSPTERRRAPRHTMGLATADEGTVRFELVALD